MITNIQQKIDSLIGRRVKVVTSSGAIFSGRLYRRGERFVILEDLRLYKKDGQCIVCKGKTTRAFEIEKIKEIGE